MQLSVDDINIVREYFKDQPVLKAYLFGSYSRNEADNDSAIDILLDLDYSRHIGLSFITMQSDLKQKLNKNIDLVSSNGLSAHLYPFIEQDKVLIYER